MKATRTQLRAVEAVVPTQPLVLPLQRVGDAPRGGESAASASVSCGLSHSLIREVDRPSRRSSAALDCLVAVPHRHANETPHILHTDLSTKTYSSRCRLIDLMRDMPPLRQDLTICPQCYVPFGCPGRHLWRAQSLNPSCQQFVHSARPPRTIWKPCLGLPSPQRHS